METNEIYRKSKAWQIWLAPMYTGVNNLFMVLMMFSSYIAAGGYGLAVATAGMIASASRVFDGITDPVIALLSDRFNSKYGKIRILMGIGYLIICASIFSMFFLLVGKGAVAYTLCYMGYIIGYTLFGVASSITPVVLTNDPVQRPKFYRWSNIYTSLVTTLFTGLYLGTVLMPKYGGLTMEAFQELAIVCMIGGGILLAVSFAAITPADRPQNFAVGTKERISLRDCWNLIKGNRPMQLYTGCKYNDSWDYYRELFFWRLDELCNIANYNCIDYLGDRPGGKNKRKGWGCPLELDCNYRTCSFCSFHGSH